ncbi:MAG: hypothetical protein M1825_005854 [Sarcosagium campestre]|nr:MAG: hypothetical protein M1825_005854 [Sarcosagium campestre]
MNIRRLPYYRGPAKTIDVVIEYQHYTPLQLCIEGNQSIEAFASVNRKEAQMDTLQRRLSGALSRNASNASRGSVRSRKSNGSGAHSIRSATPPPDPVPTEQPELEGRLNHHASQYDCLISRLQWFDEWIDRDTIVLTRLKIEGDRMREAQHLENRIEGLWETREEVIRASDFHREEVDRFSGILAARREAQL